MEGNNGAALARAAEVIAARAAKRFLEVNGLEADPQALAECLVSNIKAKLPEALKDAKEALAIPGGEKVAEATFALSIAAAGIEAAREAGFPKGGA